MITVDVPQKWSYFEPNWDWSLGILDSEKLLAKIAKATVIPFIFICTFEAFVHLFQFSANVVILVANKLYSMSRPKIPEGLRSLPHAAIFSSFAT